MSGAAPDLITGYLEALCAGLRVPADEAELIVAEDHLRETAAAGLAIGMTELAAQEAAISGFGPVRAVARAHRRRIVTPVAMVMTVWKLAALLMMTVGAGGLAGMGILAYLVRSAPGAPGLVPPVLVVYAVMAAGGLVLLVTRRLARRGAPGRDRLSPGTAGSCFLLAAARLAMSGMPVAVVPNFTVTWMTPLSYGSVSAAPPVAGALVAGCLAVAVGYGLQAALRRARRGLGSAVPGRVPGRAGRDGAGRAYV